MKPADASVAEDAEEKDPQFAYTLARGLEVLRAFDAENTALGNREISVRTGIPRPTVARLTRTLALLGYVRYDEPTARYRLTVSMLCLANPVLAHLAIRRIARPLMQQLADYAHGAVSIGARQGPDIVLVESCIDNNSINARPDIGALRSIGDTALGLAWLAAQDDKTRKGVLADLAAAGRIEPKAFRPILDAELASFRKNGFCVSRDRARRGMHAVAVPIRNTDGEVLVFNCSVAAFQLAPRSLEADLGPRLVNLAQSVEMALGRG